MKGHVLCFDYPRSETHTDIPVGLYERSLMVGAELDAGSHPGADPGRDPGVRTREGPGRASGVSLEVCPGACLDPVL